MVSSQAKEAPIDKKNAQQRSSGIPEAESTCVIAAGTIIEGNFACSESVRVDGAIIGEVRCEKMLVVGESGKVEGNIFAHDAAIKGGIDGTLTIKGSLILHSTARITGNIKALQLEVEEGAVFNGETTVGQS